MHLNAGQVSKRYDLKKSHFTRQPPLGIWNLPGSVALNFMF